MVGGAIVAVGEARAVGLVPAVTVRVGGIVAVDITIGVATSVGV